MTKITLFFSLMPLWCFGLEIRLNAHPGVDPAAIQTQNIQTNYHIDPTYDSEIIVGKTYLPPTLPYYSQMARIDHENSVLTNQDQRSNYPDSNYITQNIHPYRFLSPPMSYSYQYGTGKKENEWNPIVPTTETSALSESHVKAEDIMQNLANHVQWMDQNVGFQSQSFSRPSQNNEFESVGKSIDQILDQNNLLIKNNVENLNSKVSSQQVNNIREYLPPKLIPNDLPASIKEDEWKEFKEEFAKFPNQNNEFFTDKLNENKHLSNSTQNVRTPSNALVHQQFIQNFYQPENDHNGQSNPSLRPLLDQHYIPYGVPPEPKPGSFKINYLEEPQTEAITSTPPKVPITMNFEPHSLRTALLGEKISEFMVPPHNKISSTKPAQTQDTSKEYYQQSFVSNNQPSLAFGNLPISNQQNEQSFQQSTEINPEHHSNLAHSNLSSLDNLENNFNKITTSVYTFAANDESDDDIEQNLANYGPIRRNYRVVFIKAPQQLTKNTLRIAQALNEEKTVIYVLSKKADPSEIQKALEKIPTSTSKPEVHFLKYRTNQEAELAQKEIQEHYHTLGAAENVNMEEILPVFSVQNEGFKSQNRQPFNSYLPPN